MSVGLLFAPMAALFPAPASASCSTALATSQAIRLHASMFDILSRDDEASWNKLATPDFKAFERGKEYGRAAFFDLVSSVHKSGRRIRWTITQPQVDADCSLTVISYVNVGSIALNDGTPSPVKWLETAAYRRTSDGWQLFLLSSDRTADTPPPP